VAHGATSAPVLGCRSQIARLPLSYTRRMSHARVRAQNHSDSMRLRRHCGARRLSDPSQRCRSHSPIAVKRSAHSEGSAHSVPPTECADCSDERWRGALERGGVPKRCRTCQNDDVRRRNRCSDRPENRHFSHGIVLLTLEHAVGPYIIRVRYVTLPEGALSRKRFPSGKRVTPSYLILTPSAN